ncbi:MAG: type IX secretion system membrane protein PorP/SprF [Bacteroidota bacterium]
MKFIPILILSLLLGAGACAQQELQISQYMFNGMLLNPAYAGSHDYFSATALHRSQWVQLDDAPVTQVFAIDGPVANDRLGIGLVVSNDRLGIISQLDVSANVSAKVSLGAGELAFGLRGGVSSYSAALSDVIVWDENDAIYGQNNIQGELVTKFGVGAYYHTERWFAGVSIPVIYSLDDNVLREQATVDNYFTQHYYVHTGGVIKASPALAIKPSILVKYLPEAPVTIDLNCNFLFYNRFWIGAGYRHQDALVGMLEYNISPKFRIGYAYDFTLTDIQDYSSGSHEVMLGFDFGKDVMIKTRSPRYF